MIGASRRIAVFEVDQLLDGMDTVAPNVRGHSFRCGNQLSADYHQSKVAAAKHALDDYVRVKCRTRCRTPRPPAVPS
jgi:hypothetical protein